jgi:Tfp pilus assembly protein FimT
MICTTGHAEKGVTALELLMTAGVVAILVAFAAPLVSSLISKSELEQAIEITESSVKQARATARLYKTDVLMRLELDEQKKLQYIVISVPALQRDHSLNEVKDEINLPPGFQALIDGETIHFDPSGEVEMPVVVTVVSNQADIASHLMVID